MYEFRTRKIVMDKIKVEGNANLSSEFAKYKVGHSYSFTRQIFLLILFGSAAFSGRCTFTFSL